MYNLKNYVKVASFCRTSYKGGGVAIFSNYKSTKAINITKYAIELSFEATALETKIAGNLCCVLGLYRSPNGIIKTFFEQLEDIIQHLSKTYAYLIIIGDLNIDTSKNTDNTKTLLDLLCIYNLKIKIDKPTRVTKHSETIIDHVITNIPTCYCDTQVINSTLADHFAIMIDINIKTSDSVQKIWEMRRQNYPHNINLLKKMLEAENWETIYAAKDANTKWNQFYSLFNYYYDVTCPVSKRLVKQQQKRKSWVTGEVIHARNNLRVYYDLSKQKNNEAYNTLYKIKKKEYCSFIRETKASFIRMSIDKGKNYSKGLWSFINGERGKVTNRAEDICPLMSGKSNANPLEVANTFNRYYITVADELISQNKTNAVSKLLNPPHTNHTMVFIPTTDAEVSNLIKQLKIKHSSGLDGVTSHLIKECRECILKPLTHMLNAAIEEGIFPDSLKVSKVKPIFKKGNRDELGNYRPISLISTFAKIYEMIIKNRIVSFITKYSILHSSQHGFREGKSTKTASTDIIEHILNLLDRQQKTCGIFMDLSKGNHDCTKIRFVVDKVRVIKKCKAATMSVLEERDIANCQRMYIPGAYVCGDVLTNIKLFNALPLHIKCGHTELPKFKLVLKDYLTEKSYYIVDEYLK
ncbi:uncharacterized protein LOC124734385 [Schistocerca piceifrons]|uniref:uncharacterized protein LOC124734385 n=1 Tax=Schistocerca piceifrons TaxID=274613 RepID=UPI001F5E9886|nr:uncharacterized protein LOC124734385 [Schistocerca piceifrons]